VKGVREMDKLVAYIGKPNRNGMGIDRIAGQTWDVTDWHGNKIGYATRGAMWRVRSYVGTHIAQWYAHIDGKEYTGRGFGEGMAVVLRPTAEQQRKDRS
jgi:hypothetical protein